MRQLVSEVVGLDRFNYWTEEVIPPHHWSRIHKHMTTSVRSNWIRVYKLLDLTLHHVVILHIMEMQQMTESMKESTAKIVILRIMEMQQMTEPSTESMKESTAKMMAKLDTHEAKLDADRAERRAAHKEMMTKMDANMNAW
jgi:hypothetical protein